MTGKCQAQLTYPLLCWMWISDITNTLHCDDVFSIHTDQWREASVD